MTPAPALHAVAVEGFVRPTSIDDCVAMLADEPDARLVAGATDLGVEANLRGRRWPRLISVEAIDEMHAFADTTDAVTIGAALPLADIGRRWSDAPAAVHEWLSLFASPSIRNRATLGGNLATASPIGDSAPLLLALDARLHIAGPAGRRTIDIASFFTGYRKMMLRAGEMLTAVEIPKPLPQEVRFYKVAKRVLDDISTVAAAMAIDRERTGVVHRARFAFGGVAATPVRVAAAEEAVTGQPWNDAAVERVQKILDRTLAPMSDHRGSAEYRREVAKSLAQKFWWESAHDARR